MNRSDVKILDKKNLHEGFARLEKYKLKHRLFAGGWSQPFERELLIRYNAVAVLPYDPNLDKVVLVEQFRVGTLEDEHS